MEYWTQFLESFYLATPRFNDFSGTLSILLLLMTLGVGSYYDLFRAKLIPFSFSFSVFLVGIIAFPILFIAPVTNYLMGLLAFTLMFIAAKKGYMGGADMFWGSILALWFGVAFFMGIIPSMTPVLVLSLPLIYFVNKRIRKVQIPFLPFLWGGTVIYSLLAGLLPLWAVGVLLIQSIVSIFVAKWENKHRPLPRFSLLEDKYGAQSWEMSEGMASIMNSDIEYKYPKSMYRVLAYDLIPDEVFKELLAEGSVEGEIETELGKYEVSASFTNDRRANWQNLLINLKFVEENNRVD